MKRIVLSIFLLHHLLLSAQEDHDKYEAAVQYVACICINDTEGVEKKNCEDGEVFYENELKKYPATERLFQDFQKLKQAVISEDMFTFLSESIFHSNDYPEIKKFAEKRNDKLDGIKLQVKGYLELKDTPGNDYVDVVENNESSEYVSHVPLEEPQNQSSNSSFYTVNLWTILVIALLVIFFFTISSRIKNASNKIETLERELKRLKQFSQQATHENISVHPRVEEQFKNINERIDRLEKKTKENKTIEEKPYEVILKVDNDTKQKTDEKPIFYMATPSEDKVFHIRSKSEVFKPTQSLYKFFVDKSGENAEYEFYSDDSGIKESASSPHIYIDPVCEPQNAQNPNAKSIVTIEKGKAEKQDDKWIVTKKAKIKYE